MKRIVYIIPGYKESSPKQKGYGRVANLFKEAGIETTQIKIDWSAGKSQSFKNCVEQFLRQYKKYKNIKTYVLGFSYGAVIAFLSQPKNNPDALILCSLSPYFQEDLKKLPPKWIRWWRKHFKNSDYSFNQLAPRITVKTFLIAGDKEGPDILRRAKAAKKLIKKSALIIAKGAKHNIGQKEYLKAIQRVIGKL